MEAGLKTKIIILRVLEILYKYSDEMHPISAVKIIKHLKKYDLTVERKAIYRDITALEECGYDIIRNQKGFFLAARQFENAEVRLLLDAMQSARFITVKKTHKLIEKLGSLCSIYEFAGFKKQIFVDSRIKCENEEVFYSIDAIGMAISGGMKLTFKYLKYDEARKTVPRYGGMKYEVNPYLMVWADDAYYLIANMDKYDGLAHYRVDRIIKAEVTNIKRRPVTELLGFENGIDAAEYIKGRFTMFSGSEVKVKVKFHKSLRDVVFDRLGINITMHDEDDYMIATFKVLPSKGFFSWLFLLGDKAEILYPEDIKKQYIEILNEILNKYNYNFTAK